MAPDLRGHGRSQHVGRGGSYSLLDFVADLDRILRQCGPSAILVGHSLGAAIAAAFAAARPHAVEALVLVECPGRSDPQPVDSAARLAAHLDHLSNEQKVPALPDLATAADRLRRSLPLTADQALRMAERLTEPAPEGRRWRYDPALTRRAGLALDVLGSSEGYLSLLRAIAAPVVFVDADRADGVRPDGRELELAALARAYRVSLPGGHNLHLEAGAALAEIVSTIAAATAGSPADMKASSDHA
jgi:pimeloyl-ACP methyl ester carboxylesterase